MAPFPDIITDPELLGPPLKPRAPKWEDDGRVKLFDPNAVQVAQPCRGKDCGGCQECDPECLGSDCIWNHCARCNEHTLFVMCEPCQKKVAL